MNTLEERFWSKVEKRDETGCWLWTASCGSTGYGHIKVAGKVVKAHRVAWEMAVGTIPANMHVLHAPLVCHNTRCVNPAHLRLGTNAENQADKKKDGTGNEGEKCVTAKLTEAKVAEIRGFYAKGDVTQTEIAVAYGVSHQLISFIVRGKNWTHSYLPS